MTNINSHIAQFGLPGSNFQGGLPLYQPAGNLGSWGPSPPLPNANGSALAMPMYWQGYYGPSNGLSHLSQQPLLRPPPGLSMPSFMQQQMQYPNFNSSLSSGPSNLPEVSSPLLSASSTNSTNPTSTSVLPSTLSSPIPPVPLTTLASETLPNSLPNKAPNSALSASNHGASLPSLSLPNASNPEMNTRATSFLDKPNSVGSILPYQAVSQSLSSAIGTWSSLSTNEPTPSLVTPGQLLLSGSAAVPSLQSSQTAKKDVEVVQVLSSQSELSVPVSEDSQQPILPLPPSSRVVHAVNYHFCCFMFILITLWPLPELDIV